MFIDYHVKQKCSYADFIHFNIQNRSEKCFYMLNKILHIDMILSAQNKPFLITAKLSIQSITRTYYQIS